MLVLVPCALIDIERRIIPNRITGPAALVAIALGLALDRAGEPQRLLWAAIAGGFLLLAALVNSAGMGMGDVKLRVDRRVVNHFGHGWSYGILGEP